MKRIDIRVIIALVALSALLGAANNLRVAPEKRVSWFGGQNILAKPEGLQ